ncbi:peptidoglycan-binding domain-containing protein [Methylobacterium sp. J-068]|uniref:peptidoglycan-binding domain-containing protein n=1 Tax=Methylobacterium sp. J-068 TaxID=2836649 RepID=UPI001FBA5E3F|nr:peptidoglycan-binding domain-containing protein [Methylobacterium sp. J-068]MCJ2032694.1 peptidoglycan-binding protein [Methylobacterium sp. J-068]
MREPQARRDQREIVVPPRSREPRSAARRRPATGRTQRLAALGATAGAVGRAFLRHPGEILGVGVVLGAVAMICLNALGYQAGRHPAPIFPKVAARSLTGATPDKAKPVPPAAEGVKAEATKPETARPESSRPESSKPDGAKVEGPARTPRDGIGEIIRAGDPKGAETTASVPAQGGLSLAQAQRALVKLGYGPLKADGLMGASTRAAIERFERDRKLPVKGEPSPRTFRELATRAGASRG